ncbi:unnamed protein product [marine sediment metagenome]|uniref:Uncharacterized protein n=1 Tax=marine sediment metagenome TaxID=412755 RepID=X0TP46_9ZZZZ
MSDAGDIITAILADVTAAVDGVETSEESVAFETVLKEKLPFVSVIEASYEVDESLEWGQENRIWTFTGTVAQLGGTRETMQAKLDAIRDQVLTDRTLGSTVDTAIFAGTVPASHPDATRIMGAFGVRAEKVV